MDQNRHNQKVHVKRMEEPRSVNFEKYDIVDTAHPLHEEFKEKKPKSNLLSNFVNRISSIRRIHPFFKSSTQNKQSLTETKTTNGPNTEYDENMEVNFSLDGIKSDDKNHHQNKRQNGSTKPTQREKEASNVPSAFHPNSNKLFLKMEANEQKISTKFKTEKKKLALKKSQSQTTFERQNSQNSNSTKPKQLRLMIDFDGELSPRSKPNIQSIRNKNLIHLIEQSDIKVKKRSFDFNDSASEDNDRIKLDKLSPSMNNQMSESFLKEDESQVETIIFNRRTEESLGDNHNTTGTMRIIASGVTAVAVTSFMIMKGLKSVFW